MWYATGAAENDDATMFCIRHLETHHYAVEGCEDLPLYFVASTRTGRDEWLRELEQHGMKLDGVDEMPTCRSHHPLELVVLGRQQESTCNGCHAKISFQQVHPDLKISYRCHVCDWDMCKNCYTAETHKLRIEKLALERREAMKRIQLAVTLESEHGSAISREEIESAASEKKKELHLISAIQRTRLASKLLDTTLEEQTKAPTTKSVEDMEAMIKALEAQRDAANADIQRLLQEVRTNCLLPCFIFFRWHTPSTTQLHLTFQEASRHRSKALTSREVTVEKK